MPLPDNQKIYHIVHKSLTLPSIIADGMLYSDEIISKRTGKFGNIGMDRIKERRLRELHLGNRLNGTVGQCVPFYFCPRSVMLYRIHKAEGRDGDELLYRDGQRPIVHLVFDVKKVIEWARNNGRLWAFTAATAAAYYTQFYFNEDDFDKLNWAAIEAKYWQDVREEKQAEFLVRDELPWELVEEIGVYDEATKTQVERMLIGLQHNPVVSVRSGWYY